MKAVLFDIGGPIDMEFGWEIAVDGAIASACGLEGIRIDQAALEEASERAVAAFAPDAYTHMIETLCGDPPTVARVHRRMRAMLDGLDLFQLRPDIDGLLRRLCDRGLKLGMIASQPERTRRHLEQVGIARLFACHGLSGETTAVAEALGVAPAHCIMVGDRIDNDIAPAKSLGMATVLFRSGRHRRQRPRSDTEAPDAVVTDVPELEQAILSLMAQ